MVLGEDKTLHPSHSAFASVSQTLSLAPVATCQGLCWTNSHRGKQETHCPARESLLQGRYRYDAGLPSRAWTDGARDLAGAARPRKVDMRCLDPFVKPIPAMVSTSARTPAPTSEKKVIDVTSTARH
jgi:hypothetical protein